MVFDCTALLPVRELYPGLFGPTIVTMQQFMWLLCNNSCGYGTSSGSPTLCWIAVGNYIVWVMANRICLTTQCH